MCNECEKIKIKKMYSAFLLQFGSIWDGPPCCWTAGDLNTVWDFFATELSEFSIWHTDHGGSDFYLRMIVVDNGYISEEVSVKAFVVPGELNSTKSVVLHDKKRLSESHGARYFTPAIYECVVLESTLIIFLRGLLPLDLFMMSFLIHEYMEPQDLLTWHFDSVSLPPHEVRFFLYVKNTTLQRELPKLDSNLLPTDAALTILDYYNEATKDDDPGYNRTEDFHYGSSSG